jgi:hypothetical protein
MLLGLSAAFLATGCLEDGLPDLDTAPVADGIRSNLDSANDDDTFTRCPVDDFRRLLEDSFALLDDEVVRESLVGDVVTERVETASSPAEAIACGLTTDTGSASTFLFLEAPADVTTFSNDFTELPLGAATVDVDESRLFRGGQFYRVCMVADAAPRVEYCQVNWLDDNVMLGVMAAGVGAGQIDVNALQERFQYVLPTIVDRLGQD